MVSENCFKGFGNQVLRNWKLIIQSEPTQLRPCFVRFWLEECKTGFLEIYNSCVMKPKEARQKFGQAAKFPASV